MASYAAGAYRNRRGWRESQYLSEEAEQVAQVAVSDERGGDSKESATSDKKLLGNLPTPGRNSSKKHPPPPPAQAPVSPTSFNSLNGPLPPPPANPPATPLTAPPASPPVLPSAALRTGSAPQALDPWMTGSSTPQGGSQTKGAAGYREWLQSRGQQAMSRSLTSASGSPGSSVATTAPSTSTPTSTPLATTVAAGAQLSFFTGAQPAQPQQPAQLLADPGSGPAIQAPVATAPWAQSPVAGEVQAQQPWYPPQQVLEAPPVLPQPPVYGHHPSAVADPMSYQQIFDPGMPFGQAQFHELAHQQHLQHQLDQQLYMQQQMEQQQQHQHHQLQLQQLLQQQTPQPQTAQPISPNTQQGLSHQDMMAKLMNMGAFGNTLTPEQLEGQLKAAADEALRSGYED
eukprot:TRINITY_DN48264_c0_g1_i1.p1 TRINITY_DN48264_c0_g1~~TRINITY_DN48264_c0_g1_i1.p1  ORF type:complete len:424 (-),score=111.67 TRINITY_DN48264_c0_g1_i1:257-1456(-)